jgi:ABC-2 type transport system ATP-binding protein
VAQVLEAASGGRVSLRTSAAAAATVLAGAGATVTATGPDTSMVSGLAADAIVALLSANGVPFSEVSAHRATLEEAYLELTRGAVEFRAATVPDPDAASVNARSELESPAATHERSAQ